MDFPFQLLERMSEPRVSIWSLRSQAGNPLTQEACVRAREEHGNPETKRSQLITVGLWYSFDETVKAKAPEVVCHSTLGDLAGVDAKHLSQGLAEIFVGEAVDLEGKHDKNAEKRLDTPEDAHAPPCRDLGREPFIDRLLPESSFGFGAGGGKNGGKSKGIIADVF